MTIAVIDIDYVKYGAASVGEKRTVKAYHPVTGDSWIASNRTELYGHWQKKDKGILAEHNNSRKNAIRSCRKIIGNKS